MIFRFIGEKMSNYQIKGFIAIIGTGVFLLSAFLTPSLVFADNNETAESKPYGYSNYGNYRYWNRVRKGRSVKVIRGITVTGVNNVVGQPAYDFGAPFGTFNFPAVGVFNEDGTEPLPLDTNTPDSAILATAVSPSFLLLAGRTRADVRPEWENIPLRDVPANVDLALLYKERLPGALDADLDAFFSG